MLKRWLSTLMLLALACAPVRAMDFYVDQGSQTLAQAVQAVKTFKNSGAPSEPITIWFEEGTYYLPSALTLTAVDSGSEAFPITYRSHPGEVVRLSGAKSITNWAPVTDPAVLATVDPLAQPYLMQADLSSWTENFGDAAPVQLQGQWPQAETGNSPELFYDGQRMTLARWPNVGWTTIEAPVSSSGWWTYSGTRAERWVNDTEALVNGFFFWDWANAYGAIKTIDPVAKTIQLKSEGEINPPNPTPYSYHKYGFKAGQRYFVLNLLSEIDMPGEWYLNRATKMLYFYPPSPLIGQSVSLSMAGNVLNLSGVNWLTFQDLVFEGTRANVVWVVNSTTGLTFDGVTFRNGATTGMTINTNSARHTIINSDVYGMGKAGLSINGGTRTTLLSGQHVVENTAIHDVGVTQSTAGVGLSISGVGASIQHNEIYNIPHTGIYVNGNNHTIAYNDIHHTNLATSDSGAIYMGRSWTDRGNTIRYNYFHDIQPMAGGSVMAIYLDDQESGFLIHGNIFSNVHRGIMLGGGRDHTITNNIFLNTGFGGPGQGARLYIDGRGVGGTVVGSPQYNQLITMPYTSPPWSVQYPTLPNILNDQPMQPLHNVVAKNLFLGTGDISVILGAEGKIDFHDNTTGGIALDDHFQLSVEDQQKTGFQPVPYHQMGRQ